VSDDRISRYLADRAATIELRPAHVDAAVGRATRRRRTRRSLAAAGLALTVGATAVVLTQGGEPAAEVAVQAATVTDTPFDWAVAESSSGLSSLGTTATALTDDGSVYAVSTAPGPQVEGTPPPATLYRSTDGADWTPVALPADFWATSVAGAGSQLYAVGTSPAGGGVEHRIVSSADGGTTWSTAAVDTVPDELRSRYPGEIRAGHPSVAVRGDTVVVSTRVYADLDVRARAPGGLSDEEWWQETDDGVVVVSAPVCEGATTTAVPPASPSPDDVAAAPERADPVGDSGAAGALQESPAACGEDGVERTYTWAELGIDDELRDLALRGRTIVAVSQDGGEFTPVDVGVGAHEAVPVATDDGFTLFATRYATGPHPPEPSVTTALHSTDGVTWEPAGEFAGFMMSAGTVGGRPAVALGAEQGTPTIQLAQPDGSWLAVDPRTATDGHEETVASVAFGPLGWVAVLWPEPPEDGDLVAEGGWNPTVVHSVDGTSMAIVPVDDLIEPAQNGGVVPTVTADAVLVRVTEPDDGDPATVSPQRVVVGTPTG
jgi:hypothetical protein